MTTTATAIPSPAAELTAEEKARAAQHLATSCDGLVAAVRGLTPSQWQFKPSPSRWSIGEVVEHLTIAEDRIHRLLLRLYEGQATDPQRGDSEVDDFILAAVPDRSKKYEAPAILQPAGNLTPQELMIRFAQFRSQTLRLLDSAPLLRGRTIPHPIFGPWDGYQWLLGASAHTERHTQQVLEVKAHPEFPAVAAAANH